MIEKLLIKNYAIIEYLEIRFSKNLTIITGETGAGKSILLGALGLIMGNRADTKVLYNEAEKCVIEGYFDISAYDLRSFFEENDIDYEQEVVIRRELTPQGKSRAFVNDTPVNLKVLQELTGALIDLHQQFDTLDIHNVSFQLRMVDALADNRQLLSAYGSLYRKYQSDRKRVAEMQATNESAAREIDFLKFQLEEFHQAALVSGEQEQLEAELARLANAEEIKRTLSAAFRFLSEDERAIISQLQDIGLSVSNILKYHARLSALHERFNGLIFEIQDIADEFEQIAEDTEYDGQRIAEIQERLNAIYKLQKKHGVVHVDDLLQIQQDLQARLESLTDLGAGIAGLEKEIQQAREALYQQGAVLSARRKGVVDAFEKQVHAMLAQLSMEHSRLQVQILELPEPGPMGMDDVQFLFAANRGSRLMPIRDVASGGELSRLTLCTKSLVASAIPLPTLIFDEIDSGVSGDVALKMGRILRKLSDHHQVVVITHSPQLAAQANSHYFVYKTVREDRTVTGVRELNVEERVRAIATMLSSNPPTQAAIENAKELMRLGD